MSYDLIFDGAPEHAPAAVALAKKHACECQSAEGRVVIQLQLDDGEVVKLYRALVKLTRDRAATLHDPQLGAAVDLELPGRFPPMWAPSGPVHGRSFKAKVERFLVDHLRPHGFTAQNQWTATRAADHLIQGVNVQPGRGRQTGRFTINVYWTFALRPRDVPEAMDAVIRLHELLVEQGRVPSDPFGGWLPTTPAAKLERSFETVRRVFAGTLVPLLDELRSVEAIVSAFEAGRLGVTQAFGEYTTAQNMADCYRFVDRLADGRRRYERYLADLATRDTPGLDAWLEGERARAERSFAD